MISVICHFCHNTLLIFFFYFSILAHNPDVKQSRMMISVLQFVWISCWSGSRVTGRSHRVYVAQYIFGCNMPYVSLYRHVKSIGSLSESVKLGL